MRLAAAVVVLALSALNGLAGPAAAGVAPAAGSYVARGTGDPPGYGISAEVERRGGRAFISVRVGDRCGGFATFPAVRIERSARSVPIFIAQVGGARVSGHWTGARRIDGRVRTPCGGAQSYTMRLAG